MVFSSLATDLSANSARVSACNTKPCNTSDKSAEEVLICFLTCLTSFSFSVSTLISSSYLSSFCEYCSTSTEQHHQHTSVTAHRGGKKKKTTQQCWLETHRYSLSGEFFRSYSTFSAWASSDFRLLVTFFNSSSRSPDLLKVTRKRGNRRGKENKGSSLKQRTEDEEEIKPTQGQKVKSTCLCGWSHTWKLSLFMKNSTVSEN